MTERDLPIYYHDFFLDAGDALEYDRPPFSMKLLAHAERALGYKLPASYVRLLEIENGGYVTRPIYPTDEPTGWAEDHVYFDRVMGLGGDDGIDGPTGSAYLIGEWGYPDVGVVISSNGPTAFMLDYSESGRGGEPRVIYVDVESGGEPRVLVLAPDFETFLSGLRAYRVE